MELTYIDIYGLYIDIYVIYRDTCRYIYISILSIYTNNMQLNNIMEKSLIYNSNKEDSILGINLAKNMQNRSE